MTNKHPPCGKPGCINSKPHYCEPFIVTGNVILSKKFLREYKGRLNDLEFEGIQPRSELPAEIPTEPLPKTILRLTAYFLGVVLIAGVGLAVFL